MDSPDDSTRGRILAAAKAEMAQYGVAGARIDRIAKEARTSKERLYAYFGDKTTLAAAVAKLKLQELWKVVPFDVNDLPHFVGELMEYFCLHPEEMRLSRWLALEDANGDVKDESLMALYRAKLEDLRAAQAAGVVDASWRPLQLMNLLVAIATAWASAPRAALLLARREEGGDVLKVYRAGAEEAARRLITPPRKRPR